MNRKTKDKIKSIIFNIALIGFGASIMPWIVPFIAGTGIWSLINVALLLIAIVMFIHGMWGIDKDWGTQDNQQNGLIFMSFAIVCVVIFSHLGNVILGSW